MKITYVFPIVILLLLGLFYMGLPDLRRCALPGGEACGKKLDRIDVILMVVISLLYSAVAFTRLGNTASPESFVNMDSSVALIELDGQSYPSEIMLFSGVGEGEYSIDFSADGEVWENGAEFTQNYVSILKWNSISPATELIPKYVRITGTGPVYLGEIAFIDGDGQRLSVSCSWDYVNLIDEQNTVPQRQTFMNSSYFDEIYHARTAWENLNGVYPYEISHPPLGKLIIALGIAIFGMNPFGWRFMGTLFGVLMLPIMYIMVKKMFGGRTVPLACTMVLATDFMHFVQTRIATIDTYGVIFIMLMYLFMYLFIFNEEGGGRGLLYLGLSGVFFGLGAASKWTALYAGAGLFLIWLIYWIINRRKGFKAFMKNALFCLIFFVLVPALIYYVSYFPYGRASGLGGIKMFFKKEYFDIVSANQSFMFSYHSGLVAEHPYSSTWYQWLLNIRPILYYLDYYGDGMRSSFGAFVNPLLCWGGLLSLAVLLYMCIFRRDKKAGFILIGYLAQLLPWVFISRLTFEYHYFPCTIFLVLSLGYVFKLFREGNKHYKVNIGGFVILSAALFVLFYPALSGAGVNNALASKLLGWLPTWPF